MYITKFICTLILLFSILFSSIIQAQSVAVDSSMNPTTPIWNSYFKTKDEQYLNQILEILNTHNALLFFAYEGINREHLCSVTAQLDNTTTKDKTALKIATDKCVAEKTNALLLDLDRAFPQDRDIRDKWFIVKSALESMDYYRRTDGQVDAKVTNLINRNPSLDYVKKIEGFIR